MSRIHSDLSASTSMFNPSMEIAYYAMDHLAKIDISKY